MIRYHFDLYPRDDPRDGARVVRFTKLQSAEYRGEANGTGSGRFSIRADTAEAANIDPRGLQYVRVVREDTVAETENVVGGFWLEQGDFNALTETGDRLLTFGGAGTLAYLSRAIMASHTYISPIFTGQDPFDDTWRLYAQSTFYANGNFLGAMLWRVIYEAQHNTPGTHRHVEGVDVSHTHADDRPAIAIPDLVMDFDQFDDTDGNEWTLSSGEMKAQVGENVLAVVQRLMEAGLYVEMDPDTFELRAYQAATHRRDRTGTTWGASVIYLTRPDGSDIDTANIKSDAKRAVNAYIKRSWLLAGGNDVFGDATGGSEVPWEGFYYADVNDADAAAAIAGVQVNARDDAGDKLLLRIRLGTDVNNGYYRPYEDILLDDLVTVNTGSEQFDISDQDFPVAALTVRLREGGDWDCWVDLGSSYTSNPSRQFQVSPVPAHNHPHVALCEALTPGTETVTRLYLTNEVSALHPLTDDAGWEAEEVNNTETLNPVHQETYSSTGASTSTAGGGGAAVDALLWQGTYELPSGLAAILAAGGATVKMQARTHARHGIGVDDGAQDLISQECLRVVESDGTPRGTALALHSLASSAGSTKWPASATERNRVFPPAAASNTLSAVSGTVAGDYLVLEVGYRNFTAPVTTGGTLWLRDQAAAADLPEDETETAALNPWLEIRAISAATGGGRHPDLAGTSNQAARCDHAHHILSNRAPTTDDNISQGYPETTLWTNTETSQTYLLIDEDAGTWMLVGTAGEHSHSADDIEGLEEVSNDHSELVNLDANDHPQYALTTGGEQHVINVVAASGSTETLDLTDGNVHDVTLTDDCTLTLTGATNGVECQMRVLLRQGASPPHVVTWPASVEWVGGVEPTLQTALNAWDWVALVTLDGGTTWYAQHAGTSSGSGSSTQRSILLESGHSTPFTFDEILQESDGSDFLWASE